MGKVTNVIVFYEGTPEQAMADQWLNELLSAIDEVIVQFNQATGGRVPRTSMSMDEITVIDIGPPGPKAPN